MALLRSLRRRDIAVSAYKSLTGNVNSSHLGYKWASLARYFSPKPAGNDAIGVDLATKNENPKCPTPQGPYRTLELKRKATPEEQKSLWQTLNDLRGRKIPPNERKVMDNIHEASPEELKLLWPRAEYAIDDDQRSKIPTPLDSYHTLERIHEATPEEIKSVGNDAIGVDLATKNKNPKCPTPQGPYRTLELKRKATPEEQKSLWQTWNDLHGREIPPNERKVMDNIHEASPEELKLLWPRAEYAIDDN